MTDTKKLRDRIKESGVRHTVLAAAWGMSMPTFYSRISGQSEFSAPEIIAATLSLQLTRDERDAIFFGD